MKTTILRIYSETPTSLTLVLKKPEGFMYKPGQFILLTQTIENCDSRCNRRQFSLSSSPTEDFLQITTRRGVSRYKQDLMKKTAGSEIELIGPLGHFIINEESKGAIMLSGGIGITPLRSMIADATHKKINKPITLFYSSKTADEIVYRDFLTQLAKENPLLKIIYTITNDTPENWQGERGRISQELIKKYEPDFIDKEFYICGPIVMVEELTKVVKAMGVTEEIKTEQFSGY